MPLPRAGGPCTKGMQLRGSRQGPSCSGISIASSYWQYGLLCAASRRFYTRSTYWRYVHTRGTPADLETLRGRSGRPVCLPGHVPLPASIQLASRPTQICVFPSEPSRTDPVQGQGGRGASPFGGALLAQSDLVPRTDAPRDSSSLENSSEEGSPFSERGHGGRGARGETRTLTVIDLFC